MKIHYDLHSSALHDSDISTYSGSETSGSVFEIGPIVPTTEHNREQLYSETRPQDFPATQQKTKYRSNKFTCQNKHLYSFAFFCFFVPFFKSFLPF